LNGLSLKCRFDAHAMYYPGNYDAHLTPADDGRLQLA